MSRGENKMRLCLYDVSDRAQDMLRLQACLDGVPPGRVVLKNGKTLGEVVEKAILSGCTQYEVDVIEQVSRRGP